MKHLTCLVLFSLLCGHVFAAPVVHKKKKAKPATITYEEFAKMHQPLYFQDYYSFYVPKRGYIYWKDSTWKITDTLPPFMKDIRTKKVHVQILKDETNRAPEDNFGEYMKQYPAQNLSPLATVPIITISKNKNK